MPRSGRRRSRAVSRRPAVPTSESPGPSPGRLGLRRGRRRGVTSTRSVGGLPIGRGRVVTARRASAREHRRGRSPASAGRFGSRRIGPSPGQRGGRVGRAGRGGDAPAPKAGSRPGSVQPGDAREVNLNQGRPGPGGTLGREPRTRAGAWADPVRVAVRRTAKAWAGARHGEVTCDPAPGDSGRSSEDRRGGPRVGKQGSRRRVGGGRGRAAGERSGPSGNRACGGRRGPEKRSRRDSDQGAHLAGNGGRPHAKAQKIK